MSNWYEDEAFWRVMAPHMFDKNRWEQAVEQVDGVVQLLGLREGARVIDLCCGPGRHAMALAARGLRVTAVDLNEAYLDQLHARNADIEIVHADMRAFVREGAFDGAINLFSSFGYFDDREENMRVLRNVASSLRPGGGFVLDVMGKEVLARKFTERAFHEHEDGSFLLERRTLLDGWKRVRADWILLEGDERHEFSFTTWVYAGSELERMLIEAGFDRVALHGWYDGSDYDHEARRLVAVAIR
jgi:SAM-dependent methyltransferase